MRNAMICASLVLAMFLAWPMVFGGSGAVLNAASRHATVAVATVVVAPEPKPLEASVVAAPKPASPESCYARYERSYAACSGDGGCRMGAGNNWDVCEATGAWPE